MNTLFLDPRCGLLKRIASILLLCSLVALYFSPGVASAHSVTGQGQFSTQARIGFHSGDDWEPAITTDRYGHVYALYKHFNVKGGQTCNGCRDHMLFQRSEDGGQTWSDPRPIAPGPFMGKSGQDDPQIMVDPVDGRTVWASFMQNFPQTKIEIVKSTNFGETWSSPVVISPPFHKPQVFDKDELAVQGQTIVVAYDDGFNTWSSVSLDGGEHWAVHEVFPGSNKFGMSLSAGVVIDSHGNFFISWNSFDKAHSLHSNGPVVLWVSKSTDQGVHWTRTVFGNSGAPYPCHPCGPGYLSAQDAIAIGSDDTIYLLWGSTEDMKNFAPERIYFARSVDDGKTYSSRVDISEASAGVEHCFPALTVGRSPGDVRLAWMDTRTGAWNVFYRSTSDGGKHFSDVVRVSSYVPGYSYLTHTGFTLPYGDYFEMAVGEDNATQMVFGEGPSYQGPGNIWVSHSVDE